MPSRSLKESFSGNSVKISDCRAFSLFKAIPQYCIAHLYCARFSRHQRAHQSRSQSFVPLDQRSENESSGSNHYERTKEITEFWLSGSLRICIYGACLKWLLPELSFSDRWSRGTKIWERDCARTWARARAKHGGFALILSSVRWKMAIAHQRAWAPQLFF